MIRYLVLAGYLPHFQLTSDAIERLNMPSNCHVLYLLYYYTCVGMNARVMFAFFLFLKYCSARSTAYKPLSHFESSQGGISNCIDGHVHIWQRQILTWSSLSSLRKPTRIYSVRKNSYGGICIVQCPPMEPHIRLLIFVFVQAGTYSTELRYHTNPARTRRRGSPGVLVKCYMHLAHHTDSLCLNNIYILFPNINSRTY